MKILQGNHDIVEKIYKSVLNHIICLFHIYLFIHYSYSLEYLYIKEFFDTTHLV